MPFRLPARCRRYAVAIYFLLAPFALGRDLPVHYTITLANQAEHLVQVRIEIPPGAEARDLQLPVWNGLYQVRDFSQHVNWVHAATLSGGKLPLRQLDKSRWRIGNTEPGAIVEYEVFANDPGPFGAQFNARHAFFNLAEILMYPVDQRSSPVQLRVSGLPANWRTATALSDSAGEFSAENYDRLVDAPVEIGNFQESDFDDGGGHYRVVVDADAPFDMQKVVNIARGIVKAETDWMDDRPVKRYLFLYHMVAEGGGVAMEHADSTAIEANAGRLAHDYDSVADLTAHEFFHLWNVKRIQPESLATPDYTRENYTDTLWFVEGTTTTAADYARLHAGLLDQAQFLRGLAWQIGELERRPAHLTQSAEDASLDAWLEKYADYGQPRRSISYYNKGYLLGVLLDLDIRERSQGRASLRDLFQWLNRHYAQEHHAYPDSDGIRQAAEAVSHADFGDFFKKYVAGVEEIPWDDCFQSVGLHLQRTPGRQGQFDFALEDLDNITPQQKARRGAWLAGESQPGDAH